MTKYIQSARPVVSASLSRARRSTLSMAVATALGLPFALPSIVSAQEVEGTTEEILVTGFRASLESSMRAKKENESIVEVVTAEEIGKLPDVSIAESIARLPGLTAQRLNGRGQVISVRGLSPDFTTALLNGREQVSVGDNRGVEFDQFPSELLSGVVVYKTPDAGLIGQGLAGTVDMRTARPLEVGKRAMAASLRYEQNDIDALNAGAADDGVRYSLSYIDQFADDRLGIAIGAAHMSNPSQEERFNSWGYPSDPGALVIGGAKPYVRSSELERDGIIGLVEFKPSDTFSTALDVYYSEFEETQWLRGIELPLWWGGRPLQPGFEVENGLVTSGVFEDVKGVMRNDVNKRKADVLAIGWNSKFAMGENWALVTDLSHSEVDREDMILETYSGTGPAGQGATDDLGFTMTDHGAVFSPSLNYADPSIIVLTSPQGWGGDIVPGGQLGYLNQPTISDELNQLRLSVQRDLDSTISSIEFGVNGNERKKELIADEFFLALANGQTSAPIPNVTGTTDLSFLGIPGMVSYDPLALIGNGTYSLVRNPNADVVIKSWEVEENVSLAYAKFGLATEMGSVGLTGNFGLQAVYTDQSSVAFAASGSGSNTQTLLREGGKEYWEFLPSANLTFDFGSQNYVRFALARTLARPRMDEMRASQTWGFDASKANSTDINNSPWSSDGGNPELDPWIANAVDVSYEKYFAENTGYFALAVFYKDLESYIYKQTVVQDFTGYPSGSVTPLLFQGLSTSPQNGTGGYIQGVEIAASARGDMISEALAGFGAIVTMSFTDSDIQPDPNNPAQPLPGLSEEIANLTLYYENHGFSVRASGRYRSDFLGEVAGFGNGRNLRMVESESIVDAQIGYSFSGPLEGFSVLLQGYNLTDEPFGTFNTGDSRQIIDDQRYGRTYLVGVSWQYK